MSPTKRRATLDAIAEQILELHLSTPNEDIETLCFILAELVDLMRAA